MIKHKEIRMWGILFIILVILLAASNSVIWFCLPVDKKLKEVSDLEMRNQTDTYGGIDSVQYHDDLLETLEIVGWTFSSTEENNDNKKVSLLFKSSEKEYLIEDLQPYYRKDIYDQFSRKIPIVGMNHAFSSELATFNMRHGLYDIYTYAYENEESYGWYRTGCVIEKGDGYITEYEGEAIRLNELILNSGIKFEIDAFGAETTSETAEVEGWGILDDSGDSIINFYLGIKGESGETVYYTLNRKSRSDIVPFYGSENLESGFLGKIPLQSLEEGIMRVSLVIEGSTGMFVSPKTRIYQNEGRGVITYIGEEDTVM